MTILSRWGIGIVGALISLCLAYAPAASAADVTGTWDGSMSCRGFDPTFTVNGTLKEKFTSKLVGQILIAPGAGDDLRVNFKLNGTDTLFNGHLFQSALKPAQPHAALIACATTVTPVSGEMADLQFSIGSEHGHDKSLLKGTSVFSSGGNTATCKWSFRRSSTAPVLVGPC